MRVGLIFPSWTGSYGLMGYFARRNSTFPPLNLALLASVVEEAGHECFIIDGQVEGLTVKEITKRILSEKPDIVGFTATTPFFHIQISVAKRLKELAPDLPIIVGGPHITIEKEKADQPCFDYFVVGEAEPSLPALLDTLERNGDVGEVLGVISRRDGSLHFPGPVERIKDFSALPFPDRSKLKYDKYRLGTLKGRLNFTSIQTMRGCPWRCIFCASEALKTWEMLWRTPESVVAELKEAVEKYGIHHFFIVDDVLTLHSDHILKICDLIEEKGLDITFEGSTRANLVTEPLIERLAECGLIRLSFGLESVNTEIRDIMKKKVPMRHYVEANRILNKYNVEAMNSLMIGLPGETRETVRETLSFLAKSRDVKQANLAIAVPYPGTEFHEMALMGEHGVTLHSDDFAGYRRYGTAVTTVNELTPDDLISLQNEGFVRIYSAPWRWLPMFGKHGVIGTLLTFSRIFKIIFSRFKRKRSLDEFDSFNLPAGHQGSPKSPNM